MTSTVHDDAFAELSSDNWFDSTPAPTLARRYLLGELLVSKGLITSPQLESALAAQQRMGGLLGEILVTAGALTLAELEEALAEQEGLEAEVPASLRPPAASRHTARR